MCSLLEAMYHFPEQESPRLCPSWCCNELGGWCKHTLDENPKLCYLNPKLPFHAELQHSTGRPHCAWHRLLLSLDPSALGEVHSSRGRTAVVLLPSPAKHLKGSAVLLPSLPHKPCTWTWARCWPWAHTGGELGCSVPMGTLGSAAGGAGGKLSELE